MHLLAEFWKGSPGLLWIVAGVAACLAMAATGLHSLRTPSTHEDLSREHAVKGPSDRSFGLVFAAFFLLVALAPLRKHMPVRFWAAGLVLAFLAVALIRPSLLRPLNKVWMLIGRLMGKVITPVVTGILFFVFFTPMGLLMRFFGKDSLRLSFDKKARTYWIERTPPGPPPEEMLNQF
jgi:hypothetical protein